MKHKWIVIVVLSVSVGLGLAPTLRAAEKHEHKEGKVEKMPDTLGGIWHEVKDHQKYLHKIIQDKKIDEVHKAAFAVRDSVKLLPDKSKDLSADNLKKLKSYAEGVADAAKKLDVFGDAGDQANTEKEAKRLDTLLNAIEKLYPSDILNFLDGGHPR